MLWFCVMEITFVEILHLQTLGSAHPDPRNSKWREKVTLRTTHKSQPWPLQIHLHQAEGIYPTAEIVLDHELWNKLFLLVQEGCINVINHISVYTCVINHNLCLNINQFEPAHVNYPPRCLQEVEMLEKVKLPRAEIRREMFCKISQIF